MNMNYTIKEYIETSPININENFIKDKIIKVNAYEIKNEEIYNFIKINSENILYIKKLPFIFKNNKIYSKLKLINLKSISIILKKPINNSYILKIKLEDEYFSSKELLKMLLPNNIQIPNSYQIIGNIIHVNLNNEQLNYKLIIGEVLLNIKNIKIVVTKINSINNEFRYPNLEIIANKNKEKSLKTIHIENGIKYFIDYEKVYWNSKLQEERRKILENIKENSVLIDPFCGVGPIVIPSLKKNCKVFCNDLNSIAIDCLLKNIKLNKLNTNNIEIYNECAKEFLKNLPILINNNLINNKMIINKIDYIFINLPELSLDFLKYLKNEEIYKNSLIFCFFFCKKDINVFNFIKSKNIIINNNIIIEELRNISPSKLMYILKGYVRDIII